MTGLFTGLFAGLFVSAFLSATLLPGSSEVVLAAMLSAGASSAGLAILVATVGNTLGSCVNWAIGRFLSQWRDHRWFPVGPQAFELYSARYRRWGVWSLLLSWVPVIGDPLTVIAGVARTRLPLFALIVFIAKGGRYLVVAGAVDLFR